MKLVYHWKFQEDPVKESITFKFQDTVSTGSFHFLHCSLQTRLQTWWPKLFPGRQHLWENFIYCLGENKLKRIHDEKKQKELQIDFREQVSRTLVLSGSSVPKADTHWVAVKVNLEKVAPEAQRVPQALGRILLRKTCGRALMLTGVWNGIMGVWNEGYYSQLPAWGRIPTEKEIEISDSWSNR